MFVYSLYFVLMFMTTDCVLSNSATPNMASQLSWLSSQNSKVSAVQVDLVKRLHDKGIPIGVDDLDGFKDSTQRLKTEIGCSTEETPLQCRYSLCEIPKGRKAIAPCGCTGSQKVYML